MTNEQEGILMTHSMGSVLHKGKSYELVERDIESLFSGRETRMVGYYMTVSGVTLLFQLHNEHGPSLIMMQDGIELSIHTTWSLHGEIMDFKKWIDEVDITEPEKLAILLEYS